MTSFFNGLVVGAEDSNEVSLRLKMRVALRTYSVFEKKKPRKRERARKRKSMNLGS